MFKPRINTMLKEWLNYDCNLFGSRIERGLNKGYSILEDFEKEFDVPNAIISSAKVGYAYEKFYAHLKLSNQYSLSGTDIGGVGFTGPKTLPNTKVDFARLSLNGYVPIKYGIGASAGLFTTISGRNTNKEKGFNIGIVYSPN